MAFERGRTLAHYVIQDLLGAGGMGEVYAADDTKLKRRVAIKVLPDAVANDETRRLRFEREAQSIAALNHPHIVTVYSVEHTDGVMFLTMELVDGQSLGELVTNRAVPLNRFFAIAIPLADAVAAAHQKGITHRDLKPGNIMVTSSGHPKVLDFGLAKLVDASSAVDTTVTKATQPATADGVIVGTASYMSPEQAEGKAIDARSDLFSLGIIFYEMLTGERPFKGDSNVAMLSSILKDTPRAIPELNASVPRDLWQIVRRCLAKDPEKRLQSAKDLRNELEEVKHAIDSGELSASQVTPVSAPREPRARVRGWQIAAVAAFAAAVAVPAWRYVRDTAPAGAAIEASFTPLTTQAGVEQHPSLSPDGRWMVFAGDQEGNLDIYLQSVGGQNSINLTKDSAASDDQPRFSPDGERIAFRSTRDGGGVFVMGRTGDLVKKVALGGSNPAWSPDGKSIVFSDQGTTFNPGGRTQSRAALQIVEVDSGVTRRLNLDDGLQPDWSPDGQWIAYWGFPRGTRNRELWAVRVSGGEPVRLTNDVAIDWNPVWSPAGESLYFGSDRGGLFGLWRIGFDPVGGKALGDPQPIQLPAPLAAHFSFSADGSRMVFASVTIEQQVHVADLDAAGTSSNGRPITLGSRTWFYLDVSNDGQRLALVSRFPQEDVFVAAADGQGLRQITNDPGSDRGVRWSPDDKSIMFYSAKPGELAQVFTMAPDGSNRQQITAGMPEGGSSWTAPEWSPSGRRASAMVLGANQGFILESQDDGPWRAEPIAPVGDGKRFFNPSLWLRDESGVIGSLSPGGEMAIYRIASGKFEPLGVNGFALQSGMDWFPDGQRLVAVRGRTIVGVDIASRQERVVLEAGPRHQLTQPRVTTDGKRLYYLRNTTDSDITMMTIK